MPPVNAAAPPFTSEPGWLEETKRLVLKYYEAEDSNALRVPPMALVRCSRGGKTRALEELAHILKLQNIPVVMISLNDYSSLKEWEKADGVGAVCRRIAFAASQIVTLANLWDSMRISRSRIGMSLHIKWTSGWAIVRACC